MTLFPREPTGRREECGATRLGDLANGPAHFDAFSDFLI
jgi:hypothetical protein